MQLILQFLISYYIVKIDSNLISDCYEAIEKVSVDPKTKCYEVDVEYGHIRLGSEVGRCAVYKKVCEPDLDVYYQSEEGLDYMIGKMSEAGKAKLKPPEEFQYHVCFKFINRQSLRLRSVDLFLNFNFRNALSIGEGTFPQMSVGSFMIRN